MHIRSMLTFIAGFALAAPPGASARDDLVRPVAPDQASGTATAVVVNGSIPLAHTAQVLPLDDRETVVGPGNASKQAERVLDRLEVSLKAAHSGIDRLVKVHFYARDGKSLDALRAAFAKRVAGKSFPAVACVLGALREGDALVALDAVAATSLTPEAGRLFRIPPSEGNDRGPGVGVAVLPGGPRVYVSGQSDPGDDMARATRRTLEGLAATLSHLRLDRSQVVQVKAFLGPIAAAAEAEKEVRAFFGPEPAPPLVLVEWRASQPIEIELIASAATPGSEEPVEYLTPPALKPSTVFSRVARVNRGDLIYVSGLYGLAGTRATQQVESIFDALGRALTGSGSDFRHLVKATYYVSDDEASRALTELRPRYYDPARPPAASKATVTGVGAEGRVATLDMIAVSTAASAR